MNSRKVQVAALIAASLVAGSVFAQDLPPDLVRVQVQAEAREARRLGIIVEGDGPAPVPTAAQLEQVRRAGQDAVAKQRAASTPR